MSLSLLLLSRFRLAGDFRAELPPRHCSASKKCKTSFPKPLAHCFALSVCCRRPPLLPSPRFHHSREQCRYPSPPSSGATLTLPDRSMWDQANPAQRQIPHPQSPSSVTIAHRLAHHCSVTRFAIVMSIGTWRC